MSGPDDKRRVRCFGSKSIQCALMYCPVRYPFRPPVECMQSTYAGFQAAVTQTVAQGGLLLYDEITTLFQMKPPTEAQGKTSSMSSHHAQNR